MSRTWMYHFRILWDRFFGQIGHFQIPFHLMQKQSGCFDPLCLAGISPDHRRSHQQNLDHRAFDLWCSSGRHLQQSVPDQLNLHRSYSDLGHFELQRSDLAGSIQAWWRKQKMMSHCSS